MANTTSSFNTGSTLAYTSGNNKTSTSLSTNIIIMVGNSAVGAVQTLNISEKRVIKQIDEIGTDGHVDSIPHGSTNITGTCTRIRFDRLRIAEAFSRGFIHAASQAYPFDIVIIDKQSGRSENQISTVIKNVWINSLDVAYSASEWVITDNMGWEAETIYSHLNNGSNPVAIGGERGITHATITSGNIVNIEQAVDTGANGRRGSLDAGGLISIGDSGDLY
jgi:hypothetical protein